VNFRVQQGEALGIIGRNGAGKSTLLKILSQVTSPTSGVVKAKGKIASLLEVGTGFHPELTGRENIYLNGAIMGMRRAEVGRKFDEIVDFSGVEQFVDTPVKRYSSGMYVRLAFAVAAHLEPEILIVDEVLAVGDSEFQKKSLGKMNEVARSGRTVLFVSHNMDAIARFCQQAILLNSGSVELHGDTPSVISSYVSAGQDVVAQRNWDNMDVAPGNSIARLNRVSVKNQKNQVRGDLISGENFSIEIDYWNQQPGIKLTATLIAYNQEGSIVFSSISNHEENWHGKPRPEGLYRSICQIPASLLSPGAYDITLIICANSYRDCFQEDKLIRFNIIDSGEVRGDYLGGYSGVIRPLLTWVTTKIDYMAIASEDKQ
jgi:lipopolysaccharide transport system ATP-binding protein